jgi:carbon storage regulator
MLILSRRPGDSVIIDGGIKLVVIACDRGGVRIGIEAPPEVGILRGEIVNQIADENRRAGVPDGARAWVDSVGVKAADATPAAPAVVS